MAVDNQTAIIYAELDFAVGYARLAFSLAGQIPQPPAPTPKRVRPFATAKVQAESTDTASMTPDEVFAYYKRTGLMNDVKFFIDHARGIPEATQLEAAMLYTDLLVRKATTADRKTYVRLTNTWRRATMTYDPTCQHVRYGETIGDVEESAAA